VTVYERRTAMMISAGAPFTDLGFAAASARDSDRGDSTLLTALPLLPDLFVFLVSEWDR
jgi:hypothetical protein